jgi:hypothetical protein
MFGNAPESFGNQWVKSLFLRCRFAPLMSTLSDWSYLPLLLDGPLYLVPDPANAPVVPAPVAVPMAETPPVEPQVEPLPVVPKVETLPVAPPAVAMPKAEASPLAPPVLPPVVVPPAPVPTPAAVSPKASPVVPKIPESLPAPPRRRSKVMVLYNEQTTTYLQPAHETLLVNILKSVGLTLNDIELVNLNNIKRVDYVEILKEKTLNQFISFGIDLRELQINVPLTAYKVQRVEEINMLLADSFHELVLNTDKKRLLWTCLKQMFLK